MSELNKQQQNPYPRASGTGSVPVLFSLRNVQPAIVSGSANKTPSNQSLPKTETSDVATVPTTVPATVPTNGDTPARTGNRWYNAAVLGLVLMLMALVIRNSQSRNSSSLAKESDKAGTPDKMAVDSQANKFQAIRFQPIEPIDIGIAPNHLSSNSDLMREPIASSPLENTSSTNASLTSDSIAASSDSNDAINSSTTAEASSTPSFPSAPYLLASSGSTNVSAKPETDMIPRLDETSAPLSSPAARPTNQALHNPSAHSLVAIGSPPEPSPSFALSGNNSASIASPVSESIVDTGKRLTTRELIDAYRTKQNPAYSANTSVPAKPISNNMVVNDSVARSPSNGGTPYAPIGNEISLTSTSPIADQPVQSKSNEYQPLHPYEQNAININPMGFPAPSTDSQSQAVRRPTLNGSNRYQGQPTQQPAYAPYQSMAPAQGANSVGYPPSN
ncbi:MAG: hypothetical protein NTU79_16890 [Planctomycetota bacterium]|nr:hypothetical protein [Planctomycetota bacterium]